MKYVIVVMDGAADLPLPELGGKTPLEVARIPATDSLVREGRCEAVKTVPDGFSPGSDVAIMSLVGYDPAANYTGRAPLEAAALKIESRPGEWIFRCNLVTLKDGKMMDHSAGNVSSPEARSYIDAMNHLVDGEKITFYPGVSYRNLMIIEGDFEVTTTPPHDILEQEAEPHLPRGTGAEILRSLQRRSRESFSAMNNPAVSSIWLWGEGRPKRMESFEKRFGLRGAVITAVDLVRGIGNLIGWETIDVEGATGYYDTDYHAKGREAIQGLNAYDLMLVHIEATDEAGHEGNPTEKIKALEEIDRHIVGPIHEHLRNGNEHWRMLVLPDHPTPCSIRTHTPDPIPFTIAGWGIESDRSESFSEKSIENSPITTGHRLMERFIS
jgi:2,3-bisphosphoglycerate-independent phosphoglycerate mutase